MTKDEIMKNYSEGFKEFITNNFKITGNNAEEILKILMGIANSCFDTVYHIALNEISSALFPLLKKSVEKRGYDVNEIRKRFMQ